MAWRILSARCPECRHVGLATKYCSLAQRSSFLLTAIYTVLCCLVFGDIQPTCPAVVGFNRHITSNVFGPGYTRVRNSCPPPPTCGFGNPCASLVLQTSTPVSCVVVVVLGSGLNLQHNTLSGSIPALSPTSLLTGLYDNCFASLPSAQFNHAQCDLVPSQSSVLYALRASNPVWADQTGDPCFNQWPGVTCQTSAPSVVMYVPSQRLSEYVEDFPQC